MGIELTTPIDTLVKRIEREMDHRHSDLSHNLQWVGERAVNTARERGSWHDRTGALRSSIGYQLYRGSERIAGTGVTPSGTLPPRGYTLIVAAGMHYAPYVSARGYDVLDSAYLSARTDTPAILERLRSEWRKRKLR